MKKNWKAGIYCAVWITLAAASLTGCGGQEEQAAIDSTEPGAEAIQSETGEYTQEPGGQTAAEDDGQTGSAQERGEAPGDLEELLASWDFDAGHVLLEQVTEDLDGGTIPYTGYYNTSGERLDLMLENGFTLLFLQTKDSMEQPGGYELIMKDGKFNGNGFQENYLNAYDVITDEYYEPDLSEKAVSENELMNLNQTDLSIARNQIFARHGREFQDDFLDAVFRRKSWYQPEFSPEEFAGLEQQKLSEVEQANLKTIMKVEEQKGYRKTGKGDYTALKGLLSGSWLDLDGDGLKEQVVYTRTMEDEDIGSITLQVRQEGSGAGGLEAAAESKGIRYHPNCYIFTMNGVEWFIAVASDGMSADYGMEVYSYQQGKLSCLGVIPSYVEGVEVYPDKVLAMVETTHFQCEPLKLEYTIKNGAVSQVDKEYYEYRQNKAVALREIPLLEEKNGGETAFKLSPGDEIVVMGGDLSQWVKLQKTSTGETGWLKVVDMECFFPDGGSEMSSVLFDGLSFYG